MATAGNDGVVPGLPDTMCYLNGLYTPLNQARISVLDRGFIFGDGVYDVVPVYGGRLFRYHHHIARLARSLSRVRIDNPYDADGWLERIRPLVAEQTSRGVTDQLVYIQVSRGVAPREHGMVQGMAPTVFMMSNARPPITQETLRQGVACVSARDFRWERGDIKSTSLLGNVLARQLSVDAGGAETILFRDGWLTEASACNVWIVQDGALLGAPRSEYVLEGIRVELLRELCESCGIAYHLKPIAEGDVRQADEVILSSASKELLPVTRLDGEPIGHGSMRGKPGPVFARLYEAYQEAKRTQSI